MQNTTQQNEVIALVQEGKNVLIQAGAGTGKSSTLRLIAEASPTKNFLVLCFNSANAVESNTHPSKPSNIYYSTIHALAYREIVNKEMRGKLSPYLNYKDISDLSLTKPGLCDSAIDGIDERRILGLLRKGIQDAVTMYCRSDSYDLKDFASKKFHYWFGATTVSKIDEDIGEVKEKSVALTEKQQEILAAITHKYWLRMIDYGDNTSITHDVYLKIFQLKDYAVSSFWCKETKQEIMLDILMLDESQDTNPVALAIFNTSKLQKVVVGDSMQQLYAWRGAGNAMECFPHFAQAQLTTSFRFNNEIATMANKILTIAGSSMQLQGCNTQTKVQSHAHLCRTNASVLKYIFENALLDESFVVYCKSDLKELFSKLYHINALYFGTVPKFPNKSLKDLKTKKDLQEMLEVSTELNALIKLSITISAFGGGLDGGIQKLQKHITTDKNCVKAVGTIHSFKGLERDSVTIDDDFIAESSLEKDAEQAIANMWEAEVMLCMLYVAVTRGKVACEVPSYLQGGFYTND